MQTSSIVLCDSHLVRLPVPNDVTIAIVHWILYLYVFGGVQQIYDIPDLYKNEGLEYSEYPLGQKVARH